MSNVISQQFLKEIEAEEAASRRCLEKIPENLFEYKPHEKSMKMGYLAQLVADVPKWIVGIIEKREINFATWEKYELKTTADLLKYFENNMRNAKNALANLKDEDLNEIFYLKMGDKVLMQDPLDTSISSSLNHWVHHRGQLTVYMRLNNIPVPSIYGPSADENTFL